MADFILKAEKRDTFGRKVKRLRNEGLLPANVYGKKIKSEALSVNQSDFTKVFKQAGETNMVELVIGKQKRPTLIHNIQIDPVTDQPLHVDFLQVDLKEKVTAQVPVELVGESPAEKQGIGTVVQYLDEIEVESLPMDIPEKFEIDLTKLENIDDAMQVKDIKADTKKVTVNDDPEKLIVKIEPPKEEVEEVVEAPEVEAAGEGEGEVAAEEKPQEGEEKPQEAAGDTKAEEQKQE